MPTEESSSWFFTANIAVNTLVFVLALILFAGVLSYALYRGLLRPLVEHGEWHPANLRRALWCFFLGLSIAAFEAMLWPILTPLGKWLPPTMILIVIFIIAFTRRRT